MDGSFKALMRLTPVAAALALLFGCASGTAPTAQPAPSLLGDELLEAVGESVPGFGGMFYDDDGRLSVYIKEASGDDAPPARATEARDVERAIQRVYGKRPMRLNEAPGAAAPGAGATDARGIRLIPGRFTFAQLIEWRAEIIELLSLPGAVFLDVDEAANAIVLGVADEATRRSALAAIRAKRIPPGAVNVEIVPRIVEHQALTDHVRPVVGGTQVQNSDRGRSTLTVNAYRQIHRAIPDAWNRGFLTCAHCTSRLAEVDGARFFQNVISAAPTSSDPNYIGFEAVDPEPDTCYFFIDCRHSDAAFVLYSGAINWTFGAIARPANPNTGDMQVDPAMPEFRIVAEEHGPIRGEFLHKVGRTTGWTWGRLSRTCIDRFHPDGVLMRCQNVVRRFNGGHVMSAPGDSGSPVFSLRGGLGNADVTFHGILAGASEEGRDFLYSPITGIERDLHDLRVAVGSTPPPPPPPPSCPAGQQCCWINQNGTCACVPESASCGPNPFSGCETGEVCCEPGIGECALCARSGQCPDLK